MIYSNGIAPAGYSIKNFASLLTAYRRYATGIRLRTVPSDTVDPYLFLSLPYLLLKIPRPSSQAASDLLLRALDEAIKLHTLVSSAFHRF